jgi:uncharacterized membrane protein
MSGLEIIIVVAAAFILWELSDIGDALRHPEKTAANEKAKKEFDDYTKKLRAEKRMAKLAQRNEPRPPSVFGALILMWLLLGIVSGCVVLALSAIGLI